MAPVLIGSQAARFNHDKMLNYLSDIDVILTEEELHDIIRAWKDRDLSYTFRPTSTGKFLANVIPDYATYKKQYIEFELAEPGTSSFDIYQYVNNHSDIVHYDPFTFRFKPAPNELLYAIKMSHRFRKASVKRFLKTRRHIMEFRQNDITEIPEDIMPIYKKRFKESLNYGHPKLNTDKEGFFQDRFKYEHDTIHEAVAVNDQPAYKYFQKPDSQVQVSREMFEALPIEIKLAAVYEESAVLALERSLVPNDFKVKIDPFLTALTKVCTHTTSGWFREFAWENFDSVLEFRKEHDYIKAFHDGLESCIIQLRKD